MTRNAEALPRVEHLVRLGRILLYVATLAALGIVAVASASASASGF